MSVQIDRNAYLLFSKLVNVDGVEFWTLPDYPEIFPQDDDIFIVIGKGELGQFVSNEEAIRMDLLSERIYDTTHLWWIIALRNNFEVMPSSLKLGETIIVPSPRYVFEELLPQARG